MHHIPTPPNPQSRYIRQLVNHPGGHQQPARTNRPAIGQRHGESVVIASGSADLAGHHVTAVAANFRPAALQQLGRPDPIPGQQPVHARSRGVARGARVDHHHRPPRPSQHQRPAQPRSATADHHHVIAITQLIGHRDHLHDNHPSPPAIAARFVADLAN